MCEKCCCRGMIPSMEFEQALHCASSGEPPDLDWLVPLLGCSDEQAPSLYRAADRFRAASVGDAVHLRGLIEFSNICRRDCCYCGLRSSNGALDRYRLSAEQVVDAAKQAADLGYGSVVLQSGEDPTFTARTLAQIVERIKAATPLAVTLGVGERPASDYFAWRQAGADRYLLRIETTDPGLFARLHPDDDLEARKACLYTLKELDYQLGSGVMVGLPGQTALMLARDVMWLRELGAEMIGVGPFIPHADTPLAAETGGTVEQTLRLVAVLRLAFPYAHIPATTAMDALDPEGREKALRAGANVVMPNVTPVEARRKYALYPGKRCLEEDAQQCSGCVTARIRAMGRTIASGPGHVFRAPRPGDPNTE